MVCFKAVSWALNTEAVKNYKDYKVVYALSRIWTRCLSNTNKKLVPLAMLIVTLMVFSTFSKCYLLYNRTVEEINLGCCTNLTPYASTIRHREWKVLFILFTFCLESHYFENLIYFLCHHHQLIIDAWRWLLIPLQHGTCHYKCCFFVVLC